MWVVENGIDVIVQCVQGFVYFFMDLVQCVYVEQVVFDVGLVGCYYYFVVVLIELGDGFQVVWNGFLFGWVFDELG